MDDRTPASDREAGAEPVGATAPTAAEVVVPGHAPAGAPVPADGAESGEGAAYPYWRRNMHALFVANMMLTCGFAAAAPYLPLILRELGFQGDLETWVGYTVGLFFIVSFFFTPVWGTVADHFGRKSMVLRAGLGMGLLYSLMPFSGSPWMFMSLYACMGMFNGFVPASLALAATNTPTRYMGKALSTVQTGALLGNTLGPALGGVMALVLPRYRDLFFVTGALIFGAGLLALTATREIRARPQGPFRLNMRRDLTLLVRIPTLPFLFGMNFLFSLSFFGSIPVSAVFMLELLNEAGANVEGSRELWLGAVAVAMAVASAAGLPVWGRVLDRFEPSRVLALAVLAGALGSVPTWLSFAPLHLTLARLVFGLLAAGIMPALVTIMKRLAPQGMEARALSLGTAFGMLGMGSGPLLGGWVGPLLGLRAYFAINSALLLLGFLVWLRGGLAGR